MRQETWEVAGGWHAFNPAYRITTFGGSEAEAAERLQTATARAERLGLEASRLRLNGVEAPGERSTMAAQSMIETTPS